MPQRKLWLYSHALSQRTRYTKYDTAKSECLCEYARGNYSKLWHENAFHSSKAADYLERNYITDNSLTFLALNSKRAFIARESQELGQILPLPSFLCLHKYH